MAIKRDLSDLPPAQGLVPDPSPRFVGVLAEKWHAERDDDKPTAHGTPFRHSDAGKCARALSYAAAGIPRSDPMDIAGTWNVTLGTLLHDLWQAALVERFPGAEVEVTCATVGADGSGHIDAVIRDAERTVAVELKTVGGLAFKAAVGAKGKGTPAEGPKVAHMLQAALNGVAVDADEVAIGYLAKEAISVNQAKRFPHLGDDPLARIHAEWTFTREQFEPLAAQEARRVAKVLELADQGLTAPRKGVEMPAGAEVVTPSSGVWQVVDDGEVVDVGSTWECDYCRYQTLCTGTLPGRIPLDDVRHAAGLLAEVDAEATPVTIGEVA